MKRVALMPGDGIGREVSVSGRELVDALQLDWDLLEVAGGWNCWTQQGTVIPDESWAAIEASDALLVGATTSKPKREAQMELPEEFNHGQEYVSPIVQLRQRLDLYANIRPLDDIVHERFRMTVVRENTEGLYSGLDFASVRGTPLADVVAAHPNVLASGLANTSATVRLQTRFASERLFHFAFDYVSSHGMDHVTLADKPNVLRNSGNVLRECFDEVASQYPAITADVHNVDAVALWMVRRPEKFQVIVAENMFGDILSDLGAGLIGGLGLASSGNFGASGAYFEPVHGSAPGMQSNRCNPMAMFLTIAQMCDYLGEPAHTSQSIRRSVKELIDQGVVTYDLGGNNTTSQVTNAMKRKVKRWMLR